MKIVRATVTACAVLMASVCAYAKDGPDTTTFWVGTLSSPSKASPILLPVLFTSEEDCQSTLAKINGITGSTIRESNQQNCAPVLINTRQAKAYIAAQ